MRPRVFAVGEVLWDVLPTGPVLGGAPANVACHACALGAETTLVSRVGDDELGREVLRQITARGLPRAHIQVDPTRPTGTVSVELEGGQPVYTIHENVAWDAIDPDDAAWSADAICFGTLAQRSPVSRASIQRMIEGTREDALRVLDINLRQSFCSREVIGASLALANVLKLNEAELPVLEQMFSVNGLEPLAERFGLRVVVLTRGERGSILFSGGITVEHPGVPTTISDTIGAGDSFTAALTLGLLAHRPFPRILDHASRIASYVCSQPGATPPLPSNLLSP